MFETICVFLIAGDVLHDGILTFSNNSVPLEEKDINLDVLSVAGEDNLDLTETFISTLFDSDQLSSWSTFRSNLTKIIDTPVKESPIQMAITNTSSVMSSKIEDPLVSPTRRRSPPPVLQRPVPCQSSLEQEKDINLNGLCVAGEDHLDLSETFKSTSLDPDQLSSWSNFRSHLTKIIDTPLKESPIQMAIMNTRSVMSSKIEHHLGSLVETTTRLAEASSVPVEPRTY
ncbi:hypothetical protein CDAR_453641 [Caerostris darwini]|uniref:Uncharacterized protein n=1 Tax=Caerostris darwini TaxID=1538125 RepID=A0AAV4NYX4_9ARAC|nr:hypothetical protein CDAR_453641 [Caerostris darwini]